jgi:hypothetical protein
VADFHPQPPALRIGHLPGPPAAYAASHQQQSALLSSLLDDYQVRRYDAWYRHITLAMLANAFLVVMRATAVKAMAAADTGGR